MMLPLTAASMVIVTVGVAAGQVAWRAVFWAFSTNGLLNGTFGLSTLWVWQPLDLLLVVSVMWGLTVAFATTWGSEGLRSFYEETGEPAKGADLKRLWTLWRSVSDRAGRAPPGVRFEVDEEEEEVNSAVPSQGVVIVTRGALERLTDDELAALLAHEMAHVIGGEGWLMLANRMLRAPFFYAVASARALHSMGWGLFRWGASWNGGIIRFVLSVAVGASGFAVMLVAASLRIVCFVGGPPAFWLVLQRRGEMNADRFAMRCGYGSSLVDAMTKMRDVEPTDKSTHPTHTRRVDEMLRWKNRDERRVERLAKRRQKKVETRLEVAVA